MILVLISARLKPQPPTDYTAEVDALAGLSCSISLNLMALKLTCDLLIPVSCPCPGTKDKYLPGQRGCQHNDGIGHLILYKVKMTIFKILIFCPIT
jgi:hypothetical protein